MDPYTLLSQAQRDWLEELLPRPTVPSDKGKGKAAAKDADAPDGTTQTAAPSPTAVEDNVNNRPAQHQEQSPPPPPLSGGFASTQQERSMFIWSEFIRTGGPDFPLPHEPAFCTAGEAFYSYQDA